MAGVGFHGPDMIALIEFGLDHPRLELDVALEVETVRDVIGVAKDLRLAGVALAPLPVLLQVVGETVGILHALDIAARTGVAVPIPGAADAGARLEDRAAKAGSPQAMKHVKAGETGAHHNRVVTRVTYFGQGHRLPPLWSSADSTRSLRINIL